MDYQVHIHVMLSCLYLQVCGALYYLGHKVANLTQYSGPRLESLSSDSYHPTQLKVCVESSFSSITCTVCTCMCVVVHL